MSIINDGEILARIHKFKMFRKEGNLFIDVYEGLLGKPAHKFIAVPNMLIQESDKKYFGFGDTKSEALKDCLKKIKDVPINTIIPNDNSSGHDLNSNTPYESEQVPNLSSSFRKLAGLFSKDKKKN